MTLIFQFPVLFLGEDEIHDEKKTPMEEALGFLDVFLEGTNFVCGENLTIADCSLVASVSSLVVSNFCNLELINLFLRKV